MDDDRGPQYWRSISNMGGFVVVIGALIMMAALSQLRQIPARSGMPAPPADTCTIENKPIPCSQIFGSSPADVAQEQAQQTADHAHALWVFGFLVFLGGLIPAEDWQLQFASPALSDDGLHLRADAVPARSKPKQGRNPVPSLRPDERSDKPILREMRQAADNDVIHAFFLHTPFAKDATADNPQRRLGSHAVPGRCRRSHGIRLRHPGAGAFDD